MGRLAGLWHWEPELGVTLGESAHWFWLHGRWHMWIGHSKLKQLFWLFGLNLVLSSGCCGSFVPASNPGLDLLSKIVLLLFV